MVFDFGIFFFLMIRLKKIICHRLKIRNFKKWSFSIEMQLLLYLKFFLNFGLKKRYVQKTIRRLKSMRDSSFSKKTHFRTDWNFFWFFTETLFWIEFRSKNCSSELEFFERSSIQIWFFFFRIEAFLSEHFFEKDESFFFLNSQFHKDAELKTKI